MRPVNIALLGLGTVGSGVYETIKTHQENLSRVLGRSVTITAILIRQMDKHRKIDPDVYITDDFSQVLKMKDIDVVIEAINGCEPARTYILESLRRGWHVITANKALMARHGSELRWEAERNSCKLAYEASVAGGIPVIRTIKELLQINHIRRVEGILNGTSNFILSRMRTEGLSFKDALLEAQDQGFAEEDPTNDIEGWDSFYKLMVLCDIIWREQPDWSTVQCKGITGIRAQEMDDAERSQSRIKLVAYAERMDGSWNIGVSPRVIPESHPFYSVEGVSNGVTIETDLAGRLFFQGAGAGALPTASAIIEDLVGIYIHERGNGNDREGISIGNARGSRRIASRSSHRSTVRPHLPV